MSSAMEYALIQALQAFVRLCESASQYLDHKRGAA